MIRFLLNAPITFGFASFDVIEYIDREFQFASICMYFHTLAFLVIQTVEMKFANHDQH
jgi:hypothetical protein